MGLKQGALRGWLGLFWTNSCGKSSTKVFFCGSGQWRLRAEGGRIFPSSVCSQIYGSLMDPGCCVLVGP